MENRTISICETPDFEIRGKADEPKTLVGYASVFNQKTNIGGQFDEQIQEGAFDDCLKKENLDCIAQFDHTGQPIARTSNGSLKLSVDKKGLKYECIPANTSLGRDVMEMVRSGLVSKSSFGFSVKEDSWNNDLEMPLRTITKIGKLYDVSPVTSPAYVQTSVEARKKEIVPVKTEISGTQDYEERIKKHLNTNADLRKKRYSI